jgi:outer membrane protein TolC
MNRYTILLLPALLFGDDLKSLLEFAKTHNNLLKASKVFIASKKKELSSEKSSFYPTIDTTLFYEREDDATPFYPGTTYGAKATLNFKLYDGGKRSSLTQQKEEELNSATSAHQKDIKSIFLSITKDFYNLQSLQRSLQAREEAAQAVKAQLERVKEFYKANLATSDDIDRLQSAFDRNNYTIESLKFKIFSLQKALELEVGKQITTLEKSSFKKSFLKSTTKLDAIDMLQHNKKALQSMSKSLQSYYYPQINLQESYTFFGYEDKPFYGGQPIELLDNQNKIMATLNLRLFDAGTINEKREALKLQASLMNEKILYRSKEQTMQLQIAYKRIQTAQLKIKSSRSALKSATSALQTITKKYQAGIVDNIIYLDTLSSKTEAKALYEKSLNDLEIAYAIYYYYNAQNLEEYL